MDLLQEKVSLLKGVGPKTVQAMAKLDIYTLYDLVTHFPFRFENIQARELSTVLDGEKVSLRGRIITEPAVHYYGGRKNRLNFQFELEAGDIIQVTFFNQAYLKNQLSFGLELAVYGRWQADRRSLLGMKLIYLDQNQPTYQAVYPTSQGLKQKTLAQAIQQALDISVKTLPELLPDAINDHYGFMPFYEAVQILHQPDSPEAYRQASQKIIYQEFFQYQWLLQGSAKKRRGQPGIRLLYDLPALKDYIAMVPFELTTSQKQAVNDICRDLMTSYPMERMLQGDVGSGKTLVAFLAMLAAVSAGFQAAMLVPTEVLANQHWRNFTRYFSQAGLQPALLEGTMPARDKKALLESLAQGETSLVIGTHALIQPNVTFHNLGLLVIDEQHRFGVDQRDLLKQANPGLNVLQMTATPIPRSLAISVYGGLPVSTIDEYPRGRQCIRTYLYSDNQMDVVYEKIQDHLDRGQQVYYVLPIIEESEALDQVEAMDAAYQRLFGRFPQVKLAYLHGQVPKEQQLEVMEAFQRGDIQLLLATTIIEVGVDVANASLMVIQSADRFGLAQLHQLRGRVGRGQAASECILIANPSSPKGKARLQALVTESDGFKISEEDLRIRGMGDLMGRSQSGIPQFKFANIINDRFWLDLAQHDVAQILGQPSLISPQEFQQIEDLLSDKGFSY